MGRGPMTRPVAVIGAGWAGAVVARTLHDAGVRVDVYERAPVVGGHSRAETLCGVVYEPNGPHILHTAIPKVAQFFLDLGLCDRPYRFQPRTEIELADGSFRLMSWPIQLDEVMTLPTWPTIERELRVVDDLPVAPRGADFESYVVSMMGRTLYRLFIEGYTRKQWGCDPSELSSSFAPKRVELRRDGNRDLFRDAWQYFPAERVNAAIESLLRPVSVTCGANITAATAAPLGAQAVVVTAPLDEFLNRPSALAWRGVHLRSRYLPTDAAETVTDAYVINRASEKVPYTRTIETKRATGQLVGGTVVSEEYPGGFARHYPIATVDRRHERANLALQREIRAFLAPTPVYFCGRLAEYRYINQDEAIMSAWACADEVLTHIYERSDA